MSFVIRLGGFNMKFRAAFGTTLLLGCGLSAHAATYTPEIIALNQGGTSSAFELSINNSGTVAYQSFYRDPPNGSASANRFRMRSVDVQGQVTDSFDVACPVCGIQYQYPILNDAGQYLVVQNNRVPTGTYVELVILNPDGTTRVVAEQLVFSPPDRPDIPTVKSIEGARIALNANGDVAAIVTSTTGAKQILKFPADGSDPVVMWDDTVSNIFNIEGVDINDAGQVAFVGTENGNPNPLYNSTTGAYVTNGETTTRVIAGENFTVSGRISINNNGDVAVAANEGTGLNPQAGYVLQEAGAATAAPTFLGNLTTSGGSVSSITLNDYGQVAYEFEHALYIDGNLVLGPGDRIEGAAGEISTSFPHLSVDLRPQFGFNNLGQAVVGLGLTPDNLPNSGLPYDTGAIVRVNPEGATPDNPLLPISSTVDGQNEIALNIVNGLGVEAPIWVDPIVATGFTYTQGAGGANFASLIIPDALPLGDESFFLEFLYGAGNLYSDVLGIGELFDFTSYDSMGISQFTIKGIDIGEAVDPTDPFVVGLTFVSGGFQSTLSIDAITFDTDATDPPAIPLPASVPMLLGALGALGWVGRRKIHTAT